MKIVFIELILFASAPKKLNNNKIYDDGKKLRLKYGNCAQIVECPSLTPLLVTELTRKYIAPYMFESFTLN